MAVVEKSTVMVSYVPASPIVYAYNGNAGADLASYASKDHQGC